MDAYTFISKCIKPYISVDNFNISSGCNLCGRNSVKIDKNNEISNICCICSFMQTPNSDYFGMLTSVRAHSPVSFLNSLIIFDEKSGLTLVVSDKYAKQVPQTTPFKFVVYGLNDIIINMLNNPCKRVIIKPSIRYEEYAEYLMLSDERSLYLTTPKGGYCINIDTWDKLYKVVLSNEKAVVSTAIEYLQKIATGSLFNTDPEVREFVSKNPVLMIKLNELLSMDIHSRLFILNLLELVCNEAV